MNPAKKSISFVPSKIVAQQLEELSRITQMTPEAIIDDIVTFELANMFGSTGDSTESLRRYLDRHDYSREQAAKTAADYNAFVLRQAQRIGRPPADAAIVRSEPDDRGFFRIWFPLLESRVEKIAHQARQALQAAAA